MKNLKLFSFFCLIFSSATLSAQTNIYSQPLNHPGVNLRGAPVSLASITANFPSDGHVAVHFDGECYAAVGDRIVLAASNNGDWGSNDGHVAVENSMTGFGRPFSHTRVYPVTAGTRTYYAVGQNAVEMDGSGIARIHGNLTVEYFPGTGAATVNSTGIVFSGDVRDMPVVVGQQTIHVNAPGKVFIRFDGYITSSPTDRIILAASNTMNWSFNDGNVAVEAVNAGDVDQNSFSHTRLYNVNSAGDYTYYALAENWGKEFGTGAISAYGNLLVEYFPTEGAEKVFLTGYSLAPIDLNSGPTALATISLNAPEAGKVLAVLDGYMVADPGYDVVLAASNDGNWYNNDGSVILRALDLDQNRYSFSHTRLYNVSAGLNEFYAIGEIIGGSGSKTADLFGELTIKYIPNSTTAVTELSTENNSFELYPNPCNDAVTISFTNPEVLEKTIQLLDMQGRIVNEYQTHAIEEMRIDLSAFPANLYWIKVGEQMKPLIRM